MYTTFFLYYCTFYFSKRLNKFIINYPFVHIFRPDFGPFWQPAEKPTLLLNLTRQDKIASP